MKLEEDPYQNYQALVRTFTDGFYGPAGPMIREYLAKLEAASAARPSFLGMGGSPLAAQYLDMDFLRQAEAIFDRAETACKGDPVLLKRVRHARLPVDRAVLVLFPRLMNRWIGDGNTAETHALRPRCHRRRARRRRGSPRPTSACRREANATTRRRRPRPRLPPSRRGGPMCRYPRGSATSRRARSSTSPPRRRATGPTSAKSSPTPRPSAASPTASYSAMTTRSRASDKYGLPIAWGLYDQIGKKQPVGGAIKAEDVPGPGYNWYKLGTSRIGPSFYLYFFWSWIIQIDVDSIADPKHPDQQFDVWAKIKFEGPAFPHGKAADRNAINVERIVFVKTKS